MNLFAIVEDAVISALEKGAVFARRFTIHAPWSMYDPKEDGEILRIDGHDVQVVFGEQENEVSEWEH